MKIIQSTLQPVLFFVTAFVVSTLVVSTPALAEQSQGGKTVSQTDKPKAGDTIAVIKTNQGTMKALLFTTLVPESATNFIELAKQGKYTNVPFHRVIKNFMIQGG